MSDTENQSGTAFENDTDLENLGPYTIESRLGQGGMGVVYLAMDKNLGRPVAIKVLHPHLLKHENLKQRFRREARMHAKLMHPNIVTLLSLFEDETYMALVMEVVKGDDLKAFLRKNKNLNIKKKLRIAVEILKGLEAAHEFGMVHRDLKPANILVSNKGAIKLLDFGLAKPEEGGEDLTQSGATVGSFRYMAPEQILNNPLDARTDLYAFGILLFYMLLGKLPFDATGSGGEFEIMEKQVREPAPKPHELDPIIPIPLSNLILKLLEKNKQHRPDSAAVVRAEIEGMLEQLQFLTSPKAKKEVTPKKVVTATEQTTSSSDTVIKQWISFGRFHWQKSLSKFIPNIKRTHADLSIIATTFIILGFISISVLGMAEDTAAETQAVTKHLNITSESKNTQISSIDKPKQTKIEEVKVIKVETPLEPKIAVAVEKPAEKVKPKKIKKKKPKKKYRPKKRAVYSLTYIKSHQVKRKDKSKVDTNKPHEFRGGLHLFYPDLAKKSWLSSFKRGDSTVTFDKPIRLSKIVIHKASVGDKDFNHGFIQIEVKPEGKRKWRRVFEQKDKDIDRAVTIRNTKYPSVDGVRIKFKTQDPITIGPIDLLE